MSVIKRGKSVHIISDEDWLHLCDREKKKNCGRDEVVVSLACACVDGMCGEGWGGEGDSSVVFRKFITTIRSDKTLLNFEFQKFRRRVR